MIDFARFENYFSPLPFRVCVVDSEGNEGYIGASTAVTDSQPWDVKITSKHYTTDRHVTRLLALKVLDAYVSGEIDVEGDFRYFAQLRLHIKDKERMLTLSDRLNFLLYTLIRSNPILESMAAQHHYDQPIAFVEGYLDKVVKAHSCCVFGEPLSDPTNSSMSLEDAALNRERLICEKLQPRGKRVLDIGCGSGHFVNLTVKEYGAEESYGVTLSKNQKQDADELFGASGTGSRCRVDIKNYRDLDGREQWDCINSVGMVSHIGVGMLEYYWGKVHSLLKPDGLYHHHSFMHYDKLTDLNDIAPLFSRKWVWPNYQWYRLDEHINLAEKFSFEIIDIKCLRLHYARTIDHWYDRFLKNLESNRKLVPETTIRAWRAYLANMAIGFRNREMTVNQLLCKKLNRKIVPVVANLKTAREEVAAGRGRSQAR